ncbi:hypothetical protein II906_08735 [bacterium]|nr:hypothetical protein [bacterium]
MKNRLILLVSLFILSIQAGLCSYEDELNSLEMNKYGCTFSNESLSERLSRLEYDFFGMTQTADIDSRLDMLNKMARAIYTNPLKSDDKYLPGKKKSAIRNLWETLADINGSMTGFTPPIYPEEYYSGYSSYSSNDNYGNYWQNPHKYGLNYQPNSVWQNNNTRYLKHNSPFYNRPYANHTTGMNRYQRPYYTNNMYQPHQYIPTYGNTNYLTRSSVHILND